MTKIVYMFPGQGAQHVGMGKELYDNFSAARHVFDRAEEACGVPLKELCFNGPLETLSLTNNSQPALLTNSIAALEAAKSFGLELPTYTIGLSLGEYSALYAAGILSLEDAVKLVHLRGTAMQEAAEKHPGSMTSLLGASEEQVSEIVKVASSHGIIAIANLNCPGQIVISGEVKALDIADEMAKKLPRVRVFRLNVSGAFHSPLMQMAADKLKNALEEVSWNKPVCPVVQNFNFTPQINIEEIKVNLVNQLTGSVQFERSLKFLIDKGMEEWIEIGPGKVLSGLLRRTDRTIKCKQIANKGDVESYGGFPAPPEA